MVETNVEQDEELMMKYLRRRRTTTEEEKRHKKGLIINEMVPVLCGSSYKNKGVEILDAVVDYSHLHLIYQLSKVILMGY